MIRLLLCSIVIVWILVAPCTASHFRGALITYRKEDSTDGKIHLSVDYRIAWRRSSNAHFCDSSTISNGTVNVEGTLECLSNCQGTLGNMTYQCTDFSIDEDWTSGRGRIDAVLSPSLSPLYDFGNCCWIGALEVGHNGGWELRVRANLTTRSDTGKVNTPPGSDITPIVRLQSGCNNTIRIPVYDAEGDTVRCRWAIGNECGSVCSAFTNAVLDEETCTITYRSHNFNENGTWYAVALQIEDFLSYTPQSQPLSSIPLQFLVNVLHSDNDCQEGSRPVFTESTLPDRSCIEVPYGSTFKPNITVMTRDNTSISEIQTTSPLGLTKGPLYQHYWNSSLYSMAVTWAPQDNSTTNHLFCYTAITTTGLKSEKRCIDLFNTESQPMFTNSIRISYSPTRIDSFRIALDKQFTWPTGPAFIRVYNDNGTLIEQIDARNKSLVNHDGNNLEFNISSVLQTGRQAYMIEFDKGVIRGTAGCKLPSPYHQTFFLTPTPVRLVNGSNPYQGIVEVFTNYTWLRVCSRRFTEMDASTICQTLGYYPFNSTYRNITRRYYTDSIEGFGCRYYHSDLSQCSKGHYYGFCRNVVAIDCGFEIRLVDGNTPSSGRVEFYKDAQRYTICGQQFGEHEADLVCRALGYSNGSVNNNSFNGRTTGSILNMNCSDLATDAYMCLFNDDYYPCMLNHALDAGVECGYEVRLVDGYSPSSGRVEVLSNKEWGTICDDNFGIEDARVVCKMLGQYYGDSYIRVYGNATFGEGLGPVVIIGLDCVGNETDIADCDSRLRWLTDDCDHSGDVGIDCQYSLEYTTTTIQNTVPAPSTTIRLVNGYDRYSGRVEVWYNGQWGTVCDDNFNHSDVKVICRMLGMNFGDSYGVSYPSAYFGQGHGPILLDELACYGYETVIQRCPSNPWGTHDCSHSEDVGVDCKATSRQTSRISTTPYWTTSASSRTTRSYTTRPYWITTGRRYRLEDAVTVSCNENGWNVRVNMNILRHIYPNSLASDIYMGDNTCTGIDRGYEVVFHQGLRECLTNEAAINENLVYRNQLVYAEHDRAHPYIIRNFNWTVEIECDVNRNETSSGHFHHDLTPTNGHHVSGSSHLAVNMSFYSDPNFRHQLQGNPLHVQVGQYVYAKVFSTVSDWTIKMRVHTCYMKPTPNAGDHLNFYIIKDGCEIDTNTHIISQSTHETRFVFQDFQYSSNSDGLYMYCHATFCDASDYSRSCTQACNPANRNVVAEDAPNDSGVMPDTTAPP